MDAMQRGDVEAVLSLLAEDAAWSMPPLAAWFSGHEALRGFMHYGPLSGDWRWRHVPDARERPAGGGAATPGTSPTQCFRPFALDVMTFDGDRIAQITSFINRSTLSSDLLFYERWPEQPMDPAKAADFERFGLPDRLER